MHLRNQRPHPYARPAPMARQEAGLSRAARAPLHGSHTSLDVSLLDMPLENLRDAKEVSSHLYNLQAGCNAKGRSREDRELKIRFVQAWTRTATYYTENCGRLDPATFPNKKLDIYGMLCNVLSKPPAGNDEARAAAAQACAALIAGETLLTNVDFFAHPEIARKQAAKGFSLLANGLSKYQDNGKCAADLQMMAGMIRPATEQGGIPLTALSKLNLVMLVNGFSKLRFADARDRVLTVLGERVRQVLWEGDRFDAQNLSNLVNGFSKIEDASVRDLILQDLGEQVREELRKGFRFTEHELSNMINGFSKIENAAVRDALLQDLGKQMREELRTGFQFNDALGISMQVNGISKIENAAVRDALLQDLGEAMRVALQNGLQLDAQDLSNLVNGFSKIEDAAVRDAFLRDLGAPIREALKKRLPFEAQHLSNLVNGFSKIEDAKVRDAFLQTLGDAVSRAVREDGVLFTAQGLSNLVNGFSKIEDATVRDPILQELGEWVRDALRKKAPFTEQHLSNLFNGFSKISNAKVRAVLLREVGEQMNDVLVDDVPVDMRSLAKMVNGASKIADPAERDRSLLWAGAHVSEALSREVRSDMRSLSMLVNGLSKLSNPAERDPLLHALASEVIRAFDAGMRPGAVELGNLLAGLSYIVADGDGRRAMLALCRHLHARIESGQIAWRDFRMQEIGMVATGLGRLLESSPPEAAPDVAATLLQGLARHLVQDAGHWEEADLRTVGTILKNFLRSRCYEESEQVAPLALGRIEALLAAEPLLESASLETLGESCFLLLGVAEGVSEQRQRSISLLRSLRPAIDAKARLYREGGTGSGNDCRTRIPSVTFYQIIKAHQGALSHLSRRNRPDGVLPREMHQVRTEWQDWIKRFEAELDDTFSWNLSVHAWHVIANLQAETDTDIVEEFVLRHAEAIGAQEPEARFDWRANLRHMDHAPRAPQGRAGLLAIPRCEFSGKPLPPQDGDERYSALARLTERDSAPQLRPLLVKLPPQLSIRMLNRIINYEGRHYRIDTIGGSKLKGMSHSIEAVIAAAQGKRLARDGGWAYAVPLTDTRPGVPYDDLNAAFWPYEESFWYKQRAMLSAQPGIPGLGSHDHILEGRFPMMVMPDRAPSLHPFKLRDKDGNELELQPHDGTGFIHEDLAMKLGLFGKIPEDVLPSGERLQRANLPSQATEHYPRNDKVSREFQDRMRDKLADPDNPSAALQGDSLYRAVTGCLAKGHMGVALPTSGQNLVLPQALGGSHSRNMLVGRAPYDKPNLRPLGAQQVETEGGDGPTARMLAHMAVLQYSFVGEEHVPGERDATGKPDVFFAKGLLGVVPRAMWPAQYADRKIVLPAGDIKSNSSAVYDKARKKEDTPLDGVGVLAIGEVFEPGSAVGVPIRQQELLDGDFDGDQVLLVDGEQYPAFFEHVRECDKQWQALSGGSLKPIKSHTPARRNGKDGPGPYRHTKAAPILATRKMVLEDFTGFMARFNHLPYDEREDFAPQALFAAYEAPPLALREELRALLDEGDEPGEIVLQGLLGEVAQQAQATQHPARRQMLRMMHEDIRQWGEELGMGSLPVLSEEPTTEASKADFAWVRPDLAARRILVAPHTPAQKRAELWLDAPFGKLDAPMALDTHADQRRLERTAADLLSAGIKAGTDAPKSDTGTHTFRMLGNDLQTVFAHNGVDLEIPYRKTTARKLARQEFDVGNARASLARNPTLAAGNMEAALELLVEEDLLPERSKPELPPEDEFADPGAGDPLAQETAVLMNAARRMETQVTPALKTVLLPAGGRLVHYKDRFKSAFALREKLQRICAEEGPAAQVNDTLRYYTVFPEREFGPRVRKVVEGLAGQGLECVKWSNTFAAGAGYKAINAAFRTAEGGVFELQFHTRVSFAVRQAGHKLYKESQRVAEGSAEQGEMKERLRKAAGLVRPPQGLEALAQFEHALPAVVLPEGGEPESSSRQATGHPPREQKKEAALERRLEEGVLPKRTLKTGLADPDSQQAQAMVRLMDGARRMETQVTPALRALLSPAGGNLGNFSDRFKSAYALREKLARICEEEGVDEAQAAEQVNDVLRYYAVFPAKEFGTGAHNVIEGLAGQGFECIKWSNTFAPGTRYKGINAAFRTAEGGVFELQFHTPSSFKARQLGHKQYKESQRLEKGDPRRQEMEQHLQALADGVSLPQGLEVLAQFEQGLPEAVLADSGGLKAPSPAQQASSAASVQPSLARNATPKAAADNRERRLEQRLAAWSSNALQEARGMNARIGPLIDRLAARMPGIAQPHRDDRIMDEPFLRQRLRTADAVAQRTQGTGSTPWERSRILSDALCYRLTLPEEGFGEGAAALIAALEAEGQCTVTSMRDLFHSRARPQYKAVLAWLKTPDNKRFRVELHTAQSYAAGRDEKRTDLYHATQEPELMSWHKRHKQLFADKSEEEKARIQQEEYARDPEGFTRMMEMEAHYEDLLESLRRRVRDVRAPDTSALEERLKRFARREEALEIIAREDAGEEAEEAMPKTVQRQSARQPLPSQEDAFARWAKEPGRLPSAALAQPEIIAREHAGEEAGEAAPKTVQHQSARQPLPSQEDAFAQWAKEPGRLPSAASVSPETATPEQGSGPSRVPVRKRERPVASDFFKEKDGKRRATEETTKAATGASTVPSSSLEQILQAQRARYSQYPWSLSLSSANPAQEAGTEAAENEGEEGDLGEGCDMENDGSD
jgi:hypothetical protein